MSNNNRLELEQAQERKIDNFCEIINNNNIKQAEYYLNHADWNVELAVQYYFNHQSKHRHENNNINDNSKVNNLKRHASAKLDVKNSNIENQSHSNIDKNNYVRRISDNKNQYIISININDLLIEKEKGSQYTHDKTLLYIKNNLKNVETNFKAFSQKLVYNAGIILIFKGENLPRIKEQIIQINTLKDKVENYIIFPVSVNSEKGMDISLTLFCISFPSYIFCKYKNENEIYITDKMEGAFEKSFLETCLKKITSKLNPIKNPENTKSNMKIIPKPQTNVKKKSNEQIFQNVFNAFKGNDNNSKNRKNEINRDKNQNMKHQNQNKINNNNNYKKDIEKKKIDYNNKENIIENKSNKNRIDNNFNYEHNNIANNNIVDKNIGIKNEINNNQKNKENDKNEFRYSNYGDFFLGDSIEIPNLFGIYNNNKNNYDANNNIENHNENNYPKNNIQYENKDINQNKKEEKKDEIDINNNKDQNILKDNDPRLRDSIYNLSYGQVLAKREKEMRELEKMQEEKEKKEAEEKKKILEEEKKIKKYEQESEIAKMILAPEPDANNPDVCHIKFRLPDGEKMKERRFLKTDKISILYDYVKSIGREIFMEPDATDFDILYVGFPPKNFENSKNNTLEKEGLYPNSILQISEK